MDLQRIPRMFVHRTLDAARLPFDTTQRLLGRGRTWPAAIAVDRVEATALDVAGRVLRDDTLTGAARLQRAEADELERAARLRAAATRTEHEARRREETETKQADQRAQQARQAARRREQQLEQEKRQAERRVDQQFGKAEQAAREQAEQREKEVRRKERRAQLESMEAEAEALAAKEAELRTRKTAEKLDTAARATKAKRKAAKARS